MEVVSVVLAAITGVVFVAVGLFSLVALWRGDLLESERFEVDLSEAA